nr:acyltransferase [Nocardioides lijunqiniae]
MVAPERSRTRARSLRPRRSSTSRAPPARAGPTPTTRAPHRNLSHACARLRERRRRPPGGRWRASRTPGRSCPDRSTTDPLARRWCRGGPTGPRSSPSLRRGSRRAGATASTSPKLSKHRTDAGPCGRVRRSVSLEPQGPPGRRTGWGTGRGTGCRVATGIGRASAATPLPADEAGPLVPARFDYLDGIRAVAAMFVVVHHSWLLAYPGFPRNVGPSWLGWMLYGHMAVSVFIVVSGFSLAIAPMRRDLHLPGSSAQFIARRGWRILPTYWAALALSCVVFGMVTADRTGDAVDLKAIVVHAVMLQDVVDSAKPNGAFWSIAVEWQIYFLFPVMLYLSRRVGMRRTFAGTLVLVLAGYLLAVSLSPFERFLNITPQYIALFAMGVLAAGLLRPAADLRWTRLLLPVGVVLAVAFVALCRAQGSVWVVDHFFWVDLLVGAAVAAAIGALAVGRGHAAARLLGSRVLVGVGAYSYSIYLVHAPILWLVWHFGVSRPDLSPGARLAVLLATAGPIVLVACWLFHLVFERPFLTRRSWAAWRDLLSPYAARRAGRPAPGLPPPAAVAAAELGPAQPAGER